MNEVTERELKTAPRLSFISPETSIAKLQSKLKFLNRDYPVDSGYHNSWVTRYFAAPVMLFV